MPHDVGGACLKHSHTRVGGAIGDDVGGSGINDSDPVRGSRKDDTGRAVAWPDNGNHAVINSPINGYRRKKAAERPESSDAGP